MPNGQKNIPLIAFSNRLYSPFVCLNRPYVSSYRNSGFTLIEMVITVAIVAILATVAMPSLREFVTTMRLRAQTNGFVTDISVARNTATTRPARVIICSSSNGTTCTGSGWSSGRLMFWETTPFGGGPTPVSIVRYTEALPVSIQTSAPTTAPDPLIFDSFGRPIDLFGAPLSASVAMPMVFTICDVDKKVLGRQVLISASGQASTVPYTCP